MIEAHRFGFAFKHGKALQRGIAQHRQMPVGRLQILADGQHVDTVSTQVFHHFQHFLVGLAQPQHHAGLGRDIGEAGFEVLQQFERMRVIGARAREFIQARHGFQIVVEYVRQADRQRVQCLIQTPSEIRYQNFEASFRRAYAYRGQTI